MPNDSMGPTDDLVARLRPRYVVDAALQVIVQRLREDNNTAEALCLNEWIIANNTLKTEAIDRIITLERELEEARRHVELLQNNQAEVERLRAALGWYADRSNYGFRVDPDGRLYPQKVILDNGDRARSAIGQYPTPAEDAPTNKGEMG